MKVKLRLQNHGVKNHPYWWIVVQAQNTNPKGRYLEKVGYWMPRRTMTVQRGMVINRHSVQYWLGVGAQPTKGVARILHKFGMVPRPVVPFGSKSVYEKPEKEYNMDYFKRFTSKNKNNRELYYRQQLQEQMTIMERKQRLNAEAMANFGEGGAINQLEEARTTDIESEEVDIFERKQKFEELSKRMEKHRKEHAHLRGNDLRYNIYMKKLSKLTRMDLGLDIEAYKDYINNLKQFAHLNSDFEIFARDNITSNIPEARELVEINFEKGRMSQEEFAIYNARCEEIYNTLRKLKRESASFLSKRDKDLLNDFMKNMRHYLMNFDVFDYTKSLYDRRQKEIKERELKKEFLDISLVTERHLDLAGLSKREFEQIKLLLKVDQNLFKPSEHGTFSPHSMIVDISKYDNLTKEAKDLLYRPPKVKSLYVKYWQLAQVTEGIEKEEEHDRKILKEKTPRFPKKTEEEILLLDQILNRLNDIIEEDLKAIPQEEQERFVASQELKEELEGDQDKLYYEGAGQEALDNWRKMSPEEKKALQKGDDIDEINTTDLEADDEYNQYDYEFLENHRINLARAFLGYDGGFSIRKLKKILKKERQNQKDLKDELQKKYNASQSSEGDDEGVEEAKEGGAAQVATEGAVKDSDESDHEYLELIDDEQFQKIIEEANAQRFETEEEAKQYLDQKLKEEWDTKRKQSNRRTSTDERQLHDPYYAMMKQDKEVNSRYTDIFEVSDEDFHTFYDQLETKIGRYPIGFRHYENFQNYKIKHNDATIQDYHNEMNRQCDYDEFLDIMKQGFLQMAENPYNRWKYQISNQPADQDSELQPELFVESEVFEKEMRTEYQNRISSYLLDRTWYKLVDALEEVTDFWNYGRDLFSVPSYNIYIPTKHHLMNKPDMLEGEKDDLSYRFNVNRMSPYQTLNPLKGFPMLPKANQRTQFKMDHGRVFVKNRRLSHTKMQGFSTINNQQRINPFNPTFFTIPSYNSQNFKNL